MHVLQNAYAYRLMPLLRSRWRGMAASLFTGWVLLRLYTGPSLQYDIDALQQHYGIAVADLRLLAAGLFILSVLALIFEPNIRAELRDGKATALVIAAAAVAVFFSMRIALPLPEFRTMLYPERLWWVQLEILHLSAIAVSFVALNPAQAPGRRLSWAAFLLLVLFGLALIGLHIASIQDFPRLDLIDEPWLGSIVANWAENRSFRSHFSGDLYDEVRLYHFFAGEWARLIGNTTLLTLRGFSLLVGGIALLVFAYTLRQVPETSRLQTLLGSVTLVSLIAFARTSHSMRADIGLALYSGLVLLGIVRYFSGAMRGRRWLFMAGVALIIGLITIPTYAGLFAFAVGVLLILWTFRRPVRSMPWLDILAYAAGCVLAALLFAAGFALLSFPDPIADFRLFLQTYPYSAQRLFTVSLDGLAFLLRRYLSLSPVEWILAGATSGYLLWRGTSLDRKVITLLLVGAFLSVFPWYLLEGYLALLTPFMAYAVARAARREIGTMLIAFVLLPALFSGMMHDMVGEMKARENQLMIAEADLLTWQIPENITVVGEDKFWFTLHEHRRFVSWRGVEIVSYINGTDLVGALLQLNTEVAICREGEARCNAVAESGYFASPTDFTITDGNYLVFRRNSG